MFLLQYDPTFTKLTKLFPVHPWVELIETYIYVSILTTDKKFILSLKLENGLVVGLGICSFFFLSESQSFSE